MSHLGSTHLLHTLAALARRDSFDVDALEALRAQLRASAVWVHLVDPDGALHLVGEHGLPAALVSRLRRLSAGAPELAALAIRVGQPARLSAASVGGAASTDQALLVAADLELHAVPLRARETTLGVLSYTSPGAAVTGEHVQDVAALLSLAVAGFQARAAAPTLHSQLELAAKDELIAQTTSEKNRLSQIIESSPDGMMYVDPVTGRLVVSKSMSELFGHAFDPEKGTRQKLGILCWPDGRPLTEEELPSARVLRGTRLVDQELLVVRPDGRRIPVHERAAPVRDDHGHVVGVVVMYRDMSAQKEVERLREEFAAMVAHDLRNPIQSMLLQLNLLRRSVEEGKTPALVSFDRLLRSGARLSRMASDLLDSTRVELSRTRLDVARLDVVQAVESIVERIRPTVGEHRLTFEARGRPPVALLDPTRLDQILTNLLENAAKYSAEGTTICVWVAEAEGGVEIGVKDQGMGIAPDEVPKLFDRFYQAKRARERKTGLGLGLYITKGFVDAHGGRISVESVPDRGSTFRVWFPSAPLAEEGLRAEASRRDRST